MFDGNLFFDLAKKWKENNEDTTRLLILKEVMGHYFDTIVNFSIQSELILKGKYSKEDIIFVLCAVGYKDYLIEDRNAFGNTVVILRNQL